MRKAFLLPMLAPDLSDSIPAMGVTTNDTTAPNRMNVNQIINE